MLNTEECLGLFDVLILSGRFTGSVHKENTCSGCFAGFYLNRWKRELDNELKTLQLDKCD